MTEDGWRVERENRSEEELTAVSEAAPLLRSEFKNHRLRDDEPQMNITLLEKLQMDFDITVGGLDPLPPDEHGVDMRTVFTVMRKAVMEQKNWDVLETACLGIFSFSQFVMWNDIRARSEELARNKVVRSLMDGKLAWEAEDMSPGERVPEDGVFLPLSADASQLYAIEAATAGESFVPTDRWEPESLRPLQR